MSQEPVPLSPSSYRWLHHLGHDQLLRVARWLPGLGRQLDLSAGAVRAVSSTALIDCHHPHRRGAAVLRTRRRRRGHRLMGALSQANQLPHDR